MKNEAGRILWKEGMFIYPQHFQQWDLFYQNQLNSRIGISASYQWGVSNLVLDSDSVSNGLLRVVEIEGILPDGTFISDFDLPIEARSFTDLFKDEKLDVFLAMPAFKKKGANCSQLDSPSARYRYYSESKNVIDTNTGGDEKDITFCRNNMKIIFSGEPQSDMTVMKIGEVVKNSSGEFELSASYIPPSVRVFGRLQEVLRSILDALSAKSSSLAIQVRAGSSGELGSSDITSFWLFHTVNSIIPVLLHYYKSAKHPEQLYEVLASLAGSLLTFSTDGHPKDVPSYQHSDLYSTFSSIEKRIREMSEISAGKKCVNVTLERVRQTMWIGRIENEEVMNYSFYLAVSANIQEDQLQESVPKRVRVASANDIDIIINAAMAGIPLVHTTKPPAAVFLKGGYQYFKLEKNGEFWSSAIKAKAIAIYAPADMPGIKMELIASEE